MNGYTPIPINLATKKPAVLSYVYVRKHTSKDKDTSAVFVAGLPHDTTQGNLKDLCSSMGSVILEQFESQAANRGLLHLVDDAAVTRFLSKAAKASTSKKHVEWAVYGGPRGAESYNLRHELRFPSEETLQQQADEYMEEYAELEAARKLEVEQAAGAVDADGFQTVVNVKRKQLPGANTNTTSEPKKKKRSHEKEDFYRFQLREHRKQEMNDLLKRYQEDKEKVAQLQKKRLLKPY